MSLNAMKNTCYEIKGRLKVSAIKVRQSDRMIQMFIQHPSLVFKKKPRCKKFHGYTGTEDVWGNLG